VSTSSRTDEFRSAVGWKLGGPSQKETEGPARALRTYLPTNLIGETISWILKQVSVTWNSYSSNVILNACESHWSESCNELQIKEMGLSAPCALILRDKSRKFIFFKIWYKAFATFNCYFCLKCCSFGFSFTCINRSIYRKKGSDGEWFLTCYFPKDTFYHEMNWQLAINYLCTRSQLPKDSTFFSMCFRLLNTLSL